MRLYGFWRSTATWRVRIALACHGVAYAYVPVDLRKGGGEQHRPEFRAKNPLGHVPVLEWEEDGAIRRLAESLAIIEWLDERSPSPRLLPADPYARARARQLALIVVSGIQPLQNTSVQRYVETELGAASKPWIEHWVTRGLDALEALARETAGRFAIGDEISIADVCLVPQMAFARRFGVELAPYPTLRRIDARCATLPPFVAAHADRQVDADPAAPHPPSDPFAG